MNETIPSYTVGFENTQTTTAYIPTVFIVPPELKVGDNWYVKLPGATALVEVKIEQVTPKTVLLRQMDFPYNNPLRYEISNITFVKKVEKK